MYISIVVSARIGRVLQNVSHIIEHLIQSYVIN